MEGCWEGRSSVREMLKQHGFMYSTPTVDANNVIVSGGTFIGNTFISKKTLNI